ncbi:Os06g0361750, partial [Oryza sativa Japonica Group]
KASPPTRSLEAPPPLGTYDEYTADAALKTAGLQPTPKKEAVFPPQGLMPSLSPFCVELVH